MSKSKKFSWDKVPLSKLECEILLCLVKEDMPLSQDTIQKQTKATIGGVSKSIDKLYKKGLLFRIKDSINFYGVNPYRLEEVKKFLIGYELGKNKEIVLSGHAFVYEAELNDLPDVLAKALENDPSFIGYRPNGWKHAYKKTLIDGSFKLLKTGKGAKLIAYFRTFGFSPSIIEMINNEKFLKLKEELEDAYIGLKIGTQKFIASCPWQEYAIQKDYISVEGIKRGIKHKSIEQSYDYPEWEEKNYNAKDKIIRIINLRDREIVEMNDSVEELHYPNPEVFDKEKNISCPTLEEAYI